MTSRARRGPQCGTELVGCLMLMEVSNPSMHLNQLLKELGCSDSTLAIVNQARARRLARRCGACARASGSVNCAACSRLQVVFALLFFICRLLVGPFVVHATVRSATTPMVVKAGGVGILLVSLVWFRTIASIALYKMRKSKAKGKAKAK